MDSGFTIRNWSAFAPGLTEREQWLAWAAAPFLPVGDVAPALAEMPPMQRRRVDKLGRMALQVAWWCQQVEADGVPLVFASRHGDLARTYGMLRSLAEAEPLSPTHFGLSTHNAIAAQYSIARNLRENCLCVSAGAASAEAAFVEALGLLADGADEVLLVVYDGLLPDAYASYRDEPEAAYAWAASVCRADRKEVRFGLRVDDASERCDDWAAQLLPHGLAVLCFLIGDQPSLEFHENQRRWRWQRHA